MEVLWTSYGVPMEQHATNTRAARKQQAHNTLSPRPRLRPMPLRLGTLFGGAKLVVTRYSRPIAPFPLTPAPLPLN